ncbi:MAG: hypothetical protein MN733_10625 [Nitrososphaera sp.]|nr:hypothetical protein [Nitrososphaera sp.]
MRKPDPTRFTGSPPTQPKVDKLEMKGFSTTPADGPLESLESNTTTSPPEQEKGKRTDVRTYQRPNERTDVRKKKRVKIRHAFDIFEDQLRDLQLLQLEAVRRGKRKPKLGVMVQQAIDSFLKSQSKQVSKDQT